MHTRTFIYDIAHSQTDSRRTRKNVQPWVRTDSSAGNTTSAAAAVPSSPTGEPPSAAAGEVGVATGLSGSCIAGPGPGREAEAEAEASERDKPPGPAGRPVAATAVSSSSPCAPSKPRRRLLAEAAIIMFPTTVETSNLFCGDHPFSLAADSAPLSLSRFDVSLAPCYTSDVTQPRICRESRSSSW